ncbi:MAG TPA: protein kinase [Gemmatimonadales bacterium]|nr:protein kinase [Gemmatimonadales bacterium]
MIDLAAALRTGLSDRYVVDRELGRGGMATVYLARDLRHDRMVALKVVNSSVEATALESRFQHEIRIAARLTHPHILTVFDSGETAGHLWFTMPYVEGESLRDRLAGIGRLPVNLAVRIAREAAQALSYAHRHNVIHRDIKPENILLTDEGSTLVADFGIARAIQQITSTGGAKQSPITEVGAVIGTPAYMSPEQRVGVTVDIRTDIYSLGVVLVEMLTGETPSVTREANPLKALKANESVQIRKLRPEVPPGLEKVIGKALSLDPGQRYATMDELAEALEEFDSAPKKQKPIAARYAALAAGFAVLAMVIIYGMTRQRSAPPGKDQPLRIAVLPFTNQGDSSSAYFADGVTDAVRGKLSGLPGLQVIASTSSNQYAGTTKAASQIGQELGVAYLVMGRVRWSGVGGAGRVQVSPELVDVATGSVKWQQPFDKALTDVFEVQADISSQVAAALNLALDPGSRAGLATKPTDNLQAYDAFLKAEAQARAKGRSDPRALLSAIPLYQRAVALDPRFAEAWASLSNVHSMLYANAGPDPEVARAAKAEADSAIALAPRSSRGYEALGAYYYFVVRDPVRTIENLGIARQMAGASAIQLSMAAGAEASLGRQEDAIAHVREAIRLDPKSPAVLGRGARVLFFLHHFEEGDSVAREGLALVSDDPGTHQERIRMRLARGQLDEARRLADEASLTVPRMTMLSYMATYHDLYWVLSPAAQDTVLRMTVADFDGDVGTWALVKAEIYAARHDPRSVTYADSAARGFGAQLKLAPTDGQTNVLLALALSLTPRHAEALTLADRAIALGPLRDDLVTYSYIWEVAARVYGRVGQPEKAMDILEQLADGPGYPTRAWLRIDPYFAPLKGNPRFEKLIAGR